MYLVVLEMVKVSLDNINQYGKLTQAASSHIRSYICAQTCHRTVIGFEYNIREVGFKLECAINSAKQNELPVRQLSWLLVQYQFSTIQRHDPTLGAKLNFTCGIV